MEVECCTHNGKKVKQQQIASGERLQHFNINSFAILNEELLLIELYFIDIKERRKSLSQTPQSEVDTQIEMLYDFIVWPRKRARLSEPSSSRAASTKEAAAAAAHEVKKHNRKTSQADLLNFHNFCCAPTTTIKLLIYTQ